MVFCLPGKSFSGQFLQCWTQLVGYCQSNGINIILSQRYNSNVYYVRSQCLGADVLRGRNQTPFNGQVPYDYIMWIDSDIHFTIQNFATLLSHPEKDIVSGVYPMEGGELTPIVRKWDRDYFISHGSFEFMSLDDPLIVEGNLFEVAYAGMGFMLIKRGVFEKMEYPWFAPDFFDFGNNIFDFCSEDVGFCKRATAIGFKIWVDPKVITKHEKTVFY